MRIFFDSSAIAKRYLGESGSDKVREIIGAAEEVHLSALALTEVLSGANRLVREKILTQQECAFIKQSFAADIAFANVHQIHDEVIQESVACLEAGIGRSLDAIQIATAIIHKLDQFVTADRQQAILARKRNLKVLEV